MTNFNALLEKHLGKVLVRSITPNTNSSKSQVTVQVACTVARNTIPEGFFTTDTRNGGTGSANPLVAIAQKSQFNDNITFGAVMSVSTDFAMEKFGVVSADYTEETTPVFADDIFDMTTCINVHRCNLQNPFSSKQQPIMNPSTQEVVQYNGKDLYQHTELNAGTATYTFAPATLPTWIEASLARSKSAIDQLASVNA
jgi:hypothetical protein